jgi:chemotaxis protein methyltransferase CheR
MIARADYQTICDVVHKRSGLTLSAEKAYLLESRLSPLLSRGKLDSFAALAAAIRAGNETVIADVTEALTTNETSFFRDIKPFQSFRSHVLPRLLQARADRKRLRIWSAACSTGQEPYSLAMMLREESARLAGWSTEIIGTDLSREALAKARTASYSQFEVQRGMPTPMLLKYFEKTGEQWRLKASCKEMVSYRLFNLLDSFAPLGQFDVIFCRNVLIYFDQQTKASIFVKLARALSGDGYLFLGGAETVLGITDRFLPVEGERGVYSPAAAKA